MCTHRGGLSAAQNGTGTAAGAGQTTSAAATAARQAVRNATWAEDGWGGSTLTVPGVGRAQIDTTRSLLGTQTVATVYDNNGQALAQRTYSSGATSGSFTESQARDFAETTLEGEAVRLAGSRRGRRNGS